MSLNHTRNFAPIVTLSFSASIGWNASLYILILVNNVWHMSNQLIKWDYGAICLCHAGGQSGHRPWWNAWCIFNDDLMDSLKLCSVAQIERCSIIHQCLIMAGKCWELGERVDLLVRFWWLLYCSCIFKIQVQYPVGHKPAGFSVLPDGRRFHQGKWDQEKALSTW